MESLEAYLDRKNAELELLNGFLASPLPMRRPVSVHEAIEQKFHIAAALKAEHALHDWALTETAWAHPGRLRAGPFAFSYDYQRADLEVRGPSFYQFGELEKDETIYTASGMAAIAGLLLASARLFPEADLLAFPGSYGETLELVETHARHLRLIQLAQAPEAFAPSSRRPQILLFDSCMQATAYEAALAWEAPHLDLVVFDTTCFAGSSGRIRRVLRWADRWRIPVALVRSHTKLDSLGVEYGRLGSAVFAAAGRHLAAAQAKLLEDLTSEMRNAVRLFGGAALPAHFPPYVGAPSWRALTGKRIAAILRNSRRTARTFASEFPAAATDLHFAHGLYVTLASDGLRDEQQARRAAEEMAGDLRKAGLPFRHAGSFGFDFGAAEWFHHGSSDRYAVRIAVADLPTARWDEISHAVAQWWMHYEGQTRQPSRTNA